MADRITEFPKDLPILNRKLDDLEKLRRKVQDLEQIINALRKAAGI